MVNGLAMSLPRVLIICSVFPPANATGARRPFRLARHLADAGHKVSVFTTATDTTERWEAEMRGIDVHRFPQGGIQDARGPVQRLLARRMTDTADPPGVLIRTLAFFLLPMEFATRAFTPTSVAVRTIERPDVIIATGPVWSPFEIGQRLARYWNSTFLVDYRDPWVVHQQDIALRTTTWYGSGLIGLLKRRWIRLLEQRYTRHVHGATAATAPFMENAARSLPDVPTRTIMNGTTLTHVPLQPPVRGPLTVVHSGRLYHEQDWHAVIDVIEALWDSGFREHDLQVILLGAVTEVSGLMDRVRECEARTGLLRSKAKVPPEDVRAWFERSDMLLHLAFRKKRGIIPLKLLEYLNGGRPIIQYSQQHTEVEELLERTATGTIVASKEDLTDLLTEAMRAKRSGEPPRYAPDPVAIADLGWDMRMDEWRRFMLDLHHQRNIQRDER